MEQPGKKFTTMDAYIASFPPEARKKLERLRRAIRECAPEAEEAMAYGVPTFRLKENLVHFAAHRNHIGFYPTSSGIAAFRKELTPYKTSKGTVQFPAGEPIPIELVKRIVRFRVGETKQGGKKARARTG